MTLYLFSHMIQAWLLPPGINLLLLIFGFLTWKFYRLLSISFIIFSIASLWLLSTPIIAQELIDSLQLQYPLLQLSNDQPSKKIRSAIVVLGGGSNTKSSEYGNKYTIAEITSSRLRYAVYLHDKMHLPILVSGGSHDDTSNTEANLMAKVLKENFNISAQWKEEKSINTADEGKFVAPILKKDNITTVYLVTNACHMPRSVYAFKNYGLEIIPAPMGYIRSTHTYYTLLNYFPSLSALSISSIAMHEYVGILWYYLYYR